MGCPEIILNPDLTINTNATSGVDAYRAINSQVKSWRCSHGSPHHFAIPTPNNCVTTHKSLGSFVENSFTCISDNRSVSLERFYQVLQCPIVDDEYISFRMVAVVVRLTPMIRRLTQWTLFQEIVKNRNAS